MHTVWYMKSLSNRIVFMVSLSLCPLAGLGHGAGVDWDVYLGDKASTQFSSLDQINRENVKDLQVVADLVPSKALAARQNR